MKTRATNFSEQVKRNQFRGKGSEELVDANQCKVPSLKNQFKLTNLAEPVQINQLMETSPVWKNQAGFVDQGNQ